MFSSAASSCSSGEDPMAPAARNVSSSLSLWLKDQWRITSTCQELLHQTYHLCFLTGELFTFRMSLVLVVTEMVVAELMYLQWLDPKEPVYIYINSTGTTRDDGETVRCIQCVWEQPGQVCLLLSAVTKGKRFMMPHSKAMIQQPRVPSSGLMPASDVLIRAEEMFFTLASVSRTAATATPPPYANSSSSSPATSLPHSSSSDFSVDNFVVDNKNAPRYDAMIFEAISELADPNGSDVGFIFSFIEVRDKFLFALLFCIDQNWLPQPFLTELVVYLWKEQPRHEVPPTFRIVLSSRLRRLAAQGKLPKVSNSKPLLNFYKLPDGSETTTRTTPAPTPKPKETNIKPAIIH
ncbi:hypothetical protein HID58_006446 [Brassica napus]|uniref:H15 domain-containing protein n=1 Tax=Brassica napus TaxID=3708 RepID=A0ABQ8EBK2_BRANA|nr:hypothetical protein HID58_006446 [Brassica napus]